MSKREKGARIERNIWRISLQRIITKKALFNEKTAYLLSVESKLIQVTAWSPWACENSNTDLPVSTSHTLITYNTEPIIIENFTIFSFLSFLFFFFFRGGGGVGGGKMIELVSYPEQVEAGFQLGRQPYNKSLKDWSLGKQLI